VGDFLVAISSLLVPAFKPDLTPGQEEEVVRDVFKYFDTDSSGFIDSVEVSVLDLFALFSLTFFQVQRPWQEVWLPAHRRRMRRGYL
jgi:hypothetical protein